MKLLFIVFFFSTTWCLASEKLEIKCKGSAVQVTYEMESGMLNGRYISYYNSGKIRCEGFFQNNNRVGLWKLYNENGNLIVERIYRQSLAFEEVLPTQKSYSFNVDGWDTLREKDIFIKKRFWQEINPETNPFLFRYPEHMHALLAIYNDDRVNRYEDDRFVVKKDKVSIPESAVVSKIRIKKDGIIDLHRYILDYRIIGVEVFVRNQQEEISLGWVYYPDLASWTNQEGVLKAFSQNAYAGTYYKASVFDSTAKEEGSESDAVRPAAYQQIYLIEKEHDVWMDYMLAPSGKK